MRLLREALEGVVAPAVVSAILFEALEAVGGRLPEGVAGARSFVDGPLRASLTSRLGADADPVVDEMLRTLSAISPTSEPKRGRDLDSTREVFLDDRPPFVVVMAAGDAFSSKLVAALGPGRVTAVPAPSLERLQAVTRMNAPQVTVVDASDVPPIDAAKLAGALAALPETTVRAIWGAELPAGIAVLRALGNLERAAMPFDRREGIAPLLDVVRSRRAAVR